MASRGAVSPGNVSRWIWPGAGGRIVVLRAAAQSGKSSVGLALGGARLQLGQPVLIVEPTARPAAVEFARERLEPLLSSKPFAGILHGERHGGLGRSAAVLYRTATTGGSVSLAGAESPSQLSGARRVVFGFG